MNCFRCYWLGGGGQGLVGEAGGGYREGAHGYDIEAEDFHSKVPGDTESRLLQADRG